MNFVEFRLLQPGTPVFFNKSTKNTLYVLNQSLYFAEVYWARTYEEALAKSKGIGWVLVSREYRHLQSHPAIEMCFEDSLWE